MGKRKTPEQGTPTTPATKTPAAKDDVKQPTPGGASGSPSEEILVDDHIEDIAADQQEDDLEHALEVAEVKMGLVDEASLKEEERLRKKREAEERKAEAKMNAQYAGMTAAQKEATKKTSWEKLMQLLDRSEKMTEFITEVMDIDKITVDGARWIVGLYQNGINGILADQMGLGKTIQTIAALAHLKAQGVKGPFMVIAPLSTLANWQNEFATHCPSIKAVIYHGSPAHRAELWREHFRHHKVELVDAHDGTDHSKKRVSIVEDSYPVLITSYETCMSEVKTLKPVMWKYCVVDEAHRLKNFECKLLKSLRELRFENRLLLSGTPLQNSLPELWSLLNFCLPEVFSDLTEFESWFDFGSIVGAESMDEAARALVERERRNEVITKLHKLLKPFILRRMKNDVELLLPKKREILLWAQMKPKQANFERGLREKTLGPLMAELAEKNGAASRLGSSLNNILMQMRKNCNHPDLIDGEASGTLEYPPAAELEAECGKLALLARLLERLKRDKHRTLIFSQMTKMLDLFEAYFEERGVRYCRLDGSTKYEDRRARIEEFNDPASDCFVFLLSTRAGGLGINLTSADTVIIYDSDWNPHVDLQAQDRVHRIGQEKPVHIYRLATAHSVEGRMLKRAQSKLLLEKVVMAQGGFHQRDKVKLNATELVQLFTGEGEGSAERGPQSADISDADLEMIMSRKDMKEGSKAKPPPARGAGFEVVEDKSSKSLLSTIK